MGTGLKGDLGHIRKALIVFTNTISPHIVCGIKNHFQKGEMKREGEKEQESGKRRKPQTPVQPPSSANPKKRQTQAPDSWQPDGGGGEDSHMRSARCPWVQQGLQGGVSMGFSGRDPGPKPFPLHMRGFESRGRAHGNHSKGSLPRANERGVAAQQSGLSQGWRGGAGLEH